MASPTSASAARQQKPRARLFVDQDLSADSRFELDKDQSHYLRSVMRAQPGQTVLVFNGRDGEWRASIEAVGKQAVTLCLQEQTRVQTASRSIWLCFAPLKKDTTNFAVEKASEAGASRIWPVLTRYTNSDRVKLERLQAVAKEAAEQCERLSLPQLEPARSLDDLLAQWPQDRPLIACAETGATRRPLLTALEQISDTRPADQGLGFLIGPEGGFHPDELELLQRQPFVITVSLGAHILRAETAVAVALGGLQLFLESAQP